VEDPTAWLTYEDGPLALVIEVASERTRGQERDKRDETYAGQLHVQEYVYVDLPHDVLELWSLGPDGYEPVPPDAEGRLWSREFSIGFARMPGERLVRVIDVEGEVVSTAQEEVALRREAEARATREAQRAVRAAQRAEREARRAQQEAQQRAAAEQRAAELTAEVERLRRLLQNGDASSSPKE
jgi:putative restriction endonuclease